MIRHLFFGFLITLTLACGSSNDPEGSNASNSLLSSNDEFVLLEKGSSSEFKGEGLYIFTNDSIWKDHYAIHQGLLFSSASHSVDFSSEYVVAIHLGSKPNASYQVEVVSVAYDSTDNVYHVRYKESQKEGQWAENASFPGSGAKTDSFKLV